MEQAKLNEGIYAFVLALSQRKKVELAFGALIGCNEILAMARADAKG